MRSEIERKPRECQYSKGQFICRITKNIVLYLSIDSRPSVLDVIAASLTPLTVAPGVKGVIGSEGFAFDQGVHVEIAEPFRDANSGPINNRQTSALIAAA